MCCSCRDPYGLKNHSKFKQQQTSNIFNKDKRRENNNVKKNISKYVHEKLTDAKTTKLLFIDL